MRDLRTRLRGALAGGTGTTSDFDLNAEAIPRDRRALRGAAVLVGVRETGSVLLTKRASHLSNHPGQIAFPGGKIEPDDPDETAAALREAHEEIALVPDDVEVLGQLSPHETVTGFRMTPILGLVKGDRPLHPEAGEVAEIFEVPLGFLSEPSHYAVQWREWRGSRRHYYTVPYGPYYIWGATARILRDLAERLR